MSKIQKWYTVSHPEPGDIATAKFADLDPREVSRVDGEFIYLIIGTLPEAGPFPASNYTYERRM